MIFLQVHIGNDADPNRIYFKNNILWNGKIYAHIFGEAATISWVIEKFIKWLWVLEFTVISYCSVLSKFFMTEANMLHMVHR